MGYVVMPHVVRYFLSWRPTLGNNRMSSISTTLSTFNGPPNLTSHYYPYFSLLLSFPFSSSLKQSISNPPTSVACSTSSWIPWRLGRSVILFSFVASPPFNDRRQSSTLWNTFWDADVYVVETQDDQSLRALNNTFDDIMVLHSNSDTDKRSRHIVGWSEAIDQRRCGSSCRVSFHVLCLFVRPLWTHSPFPLIDLFRCWSIYERFL